MSYGWARTEILGALTNGVFLLSLCLYTSLEAIPEVIEAITGTSADEPAGLYFIVVAAGGLAVNTIGTVVFAITGQSHGHSHAGGGHGHSHGGHGHSHGGHEEDDEHTPLTDVHEYDDHNHSHDHGHAHSHGEKKKKKDLNIQAVFLHYAGDMVSSFFVLIAGILLYYFEDSAWIAFIDPVTSLIICLLILFTTLPLVRSCLHILLQSTPKDIDIPRLRGNIRQIDGVVNIHDFHAWQLTDGLIISSLHVVCEQGCNFAVIAKKIKKILHKAGIHSTAIQPEFIPLEPNAPVGDSCQENCVEDCNEDWCCKTPEVPTKGLSSRKKPHSHGESIN